LLQARIQGDAGDRTRNLFWVDSTPGRPVLVWQSDSFDLPSDERTPINLAREPGLRIWLHEAAQSTEILAQFHHSCCDGLGAMQFLRTLLEFYDGRSEEGPPAGWLAPRWVAGARLAGRIDLDA
jgi:hypothetical protein